MPCKENNFKAHILDGYFLFHLALIFFILRIIVVPFFIYFPKSAFFAEIISSEILELLNQQRASYGLSVLRENERLKKAAYWKAQDMLDNDYFGHKNPAGITGWRWIQKAGYEYEKAGENLAIGFLESKEVHQAWNDSAQHQNNLLNPYFQDVGMAVLKGDFQENEVAIVVQFFGSPKSEPISREKILPVAEAKTEELELREVAEELLPPEISILEEKKTSLQSEFWEFVIKEYSEAVKKVIFLLAFLIVFVLILNLIVILSLSFNLSARLEILSSFLPGALLCIILLILLGFFDKSFILQFIPHRLEI